jgi:hemerythrin
MDNKWIWNSKLETGIKIIDEQHMTLVDMVNRLMTELNAGKRDFVVSETIDFLEAYILLHFTEEEILQKNIKFTFYDEHKKIHEDFTNRFLIIKSDFEKYGVNPDITLRLSEFVADWLIDHICIEDKKIADFINEKKVK